MTREEYRKQVVWYLRIDGKLSETEAETYSTAISTDDRLDGKEVGKVVIAADL